MDISSITSAEDLAFKIFVPYSEKQAQLESLANSALLNGIDLYQKKDYQGAAAAFQRSVNLMPASSYSVDASKYLAQSFLKLDDPEKAIQAYQKALAYHRDRDDLNTALGNLYFAEDRFEEAVKQYKEAVKNNPTVNNLFSLGQGYIKTGEFNKAEEQFNAYIRREPESAYGNYGLGQTYYKQGRHEDAIAQFEAALEKDRNFYDVYIDMGYAYANLGQIDNAKEVLEKLEEEDETLAATLNLYINQVEPPKIAFAWADSSFRYNMSVNTPLAALDSYFEEAGASKIMTMKFMFTKDMERSSIENRFNWNISKASDSSPAKTYNFGQPLSLNDVSIPAYPDSVYYDSEKLTATVFFTVKQNETADGTLDPGHVIFKFNGEDANEISMNSDYDEFSGFSRVA